MADPSCKDVDDGRYDGNVTHYGDGITDGWIRQHESSQQPSEQGRASDYRQIMAEYTSEEGRSRHSEAYSHTRRSRSPWSLIMNLSSDGACKSTVSFDHREQPIPAYAEVVGNRQHLETLTEAEGELDSDDKDSRQQQRPQRMFYRPFYSVQSATGYGTLPRQSLLPDGRQKPQSMMGWGAASNGGETGVVAMPRNSKWERMYGCTRPMCARLLQFVLFATVVALLVALSRGWKEASRDDDVGPPFPTLWNNC